MNRLLQPSLAVLSMASISLAAPAAAELIHDADYDILKAQHAEQWAADDKAVDAKLAAFKAKNGGK